MSDEKYKKSRGRKIFNFSSFNLPLKKACYTKKINIFNDTLFLIVKIVNIVLKTGKKIFRK
jgi:hypothetical protein